MPGLGVGARDLKFFVDGSWGRVELGARWFAPGTGPGFGLESKGWG